MEENNELFLKCDCHTEAIEIQRVTRERVKMEKARKKENKKI